MSVAIHRVCKMSGENREQITQPVVRYTSGEEVAVGTLFCVGRNYAQHAKEMGSEVPSEPFIFLKPPTAIIGTGDSVRIPPISNDLHHEVELVVLVDRVMKNVSRTDALAGVAAVAVGLDMTLRDVQAVAKREGKPWSVAKGFDTSAPVGPLLRLDRIGRISDLSFSLKVNGEVRQHGEWSGMIFSVAEILSWLSTIFTLRPGDLLFTGTPEGVGRVVPGDLLEAVIEGYEESLLRVDVADPTSSSRLRAGTS